MNFLRSTARRCFSLTHQEWRLISNYTSRLYNIHSVGCRNCLNVEQGGRTTVPTRQGIISVCSRRALSTSSSHNAAKKKNAKRDIIKPIQLNKPKSLRMQREVVEIHTGLTVEQLADLLNKDVDHVLEAMLYVKNEDRSKYDQPNSVIDNMNVIKQVVDISGFRWKIKSGSGADSVEEKSKDVFRRPPPTDPSVLVKRPPVVTIMGHVDHGKTTLLDALRNTNVVAQEFGGITQHIGAFSVTLSSGEMITFLDTPGHAAFSAMRVRGASITDIVVLVVAADDGVMRQTVESIQCARDANVPLIVAINKMDKPEADEERTRQTLLQQGIELEGHGGDVQAIPISALKGYNLDLLQESIVALAEVLETRADPTGLVEAAVIESRTDPGRGKLSTALVQRGILRKGHILVAGTAWAKVRGMFNDKGRPVDAVGPGYPVEIIGWRELPGAGEDILQVETEQEAKDVVLWRQHRQMEERAAGDVEVIRKKTAEHDEQYQAQRQRRLEMGLRYGNRAMGPRAKETIVSDTRPQVAVVLKGDVDGSVEAILDVLQTFDQSHHSSQCRLHILSYGVGVVTEQDVEMAAAFNGLIYGFNVPLSSKVGALAKSRNVPIKSHKVIYHLVEDLQKALEDKLPSLEVEEIIGEANVLQPFTVTDGKKKITVAGCRCVKGSLQKKQCFKLVRNGETLHEGDLSSLKHFKNEVESIKTDVECGLSFTNQSISPAFGDVIVCFQRQQKKQKLDWKLDF